MTMGSLSLDNQLAVVTGAGEGIGRAIAVRLGELGAHVVVTDRDAAKAERAAAEIRKSAIETSAEALDVTDVASIDLALARVLSKHGRIDIWCNNAGVSTMQRFIDISEEEWDFNFEVNSKGTFLCSRAIARQMLKQDRLADGLRGKIINVASVAGKTGKASYLAHYIASKFAVVGLTQAMASELSPEGITVNAVCPGYVRTAMQEREIAWEANLRGLTSEQVQELYIKDTPLGRLETPEDVAGVIGFLASPQGNFMTGISLTVSGGAWME
ncbi:SDR family oxidoreductase [Bradyrhizobium sp. SSUT18]|uniref:SDR family NAD(P)-dependent oxidoreductase n=1 Tax=Bradyrhizobium sp. SSUT18 TaxID=3040602 RepID=UPI00244A695F|nr:SDR family NAD(P)-dependent oxidoreductase [Bradyrhizobium sp. SSUT18]MDH2398388.1 SDR family oxidoreductase [Bradyrhizobium sp. SSUT18]